MVLEQMIGTGMSIRRLNFSRGDFAILTQHATTNDPESHYRVEIIQL
jgi:pyruvate kinase